MEKGTLHRTQDLLDQELRKSVISKWTALAEVFGCIGSMVAMTHGIKGWIYGDDNREAKNVMDVGTDE